MTRRRRAGSALVAFREPPAVAAPRRVEARSEGAGVAGRPEATSVWTVTVLVAVLNAQREGVRLTEDLPVRLASTLGTVVPEELTIPRGESARFVQVTVEHGRRRHDLGAVAVRSTER